MKEIILIYFQLDKLRDCIRGSQKDQYQVHIRVHKKKIQMNSVNKEIIGLNLKNGKAKTTIK